jgi:dipeptidyl aminopeptidase/acylaminoacyl peptidase
MRTHHRAPALIVLAALLAPAHAAAADAFSLEQVLGAPFPTGVVAAPAGGRVAWVFDEAGARNVWAADPPEYRGRPVTAYTEDDGQRISELDWAPDGRTLLYVRGGEEEGGEYPNPRSEPTVPPQEVWAAPIEKGEPRRIGEGRSPRVSPRGDRVAFLRKGQVWWAPLDGKQPPEQVFHTRGECESLRWSPDGARLAFVCDRRDHSFIGVYDWAAKAVRWLDPSVDRDQSPVWSSDGRQLAFIRLPARLSGDPGYGARREGEPWSVRLADASSGEGRQVWKADRGAGSVFRGAAGDDQLWWGDGDRLVFPWEKDGCTHLYAVPAGGGEAALLTPGDFEVEWVALTPDRRRLVLGTNQDDIDRRHLWSVAVAGGPPTRLTEGKGIEWAPAPTGDGKAVAFLRSDARRPARPAIRVGSEEAMDLAPDAIKETFPEKALVEPRPVEIAAADGMTIHCQLFAPPGQKHGERRPAVVFFHGGSRRQMLLGWHYMAYYHRAYALNQYLASRGYVVLSVNYRSGIGYGMEFREALHYGAAGASEFNDVQGAGLYLRGRDDVDPKRIGVWGGSYGGYLTALGLSRAPDLFAAGVDMHGVYDWNAELSLGRPGYDPERPDRARLAFESSPAASVKDWRAPVLVVHGDDDRNVPFGESVRLVADLRKQKVEVEQLIFPDDVHVFLTHEHWLRAYRATADFFDRRLKEADRP